MIVISVSIFMCLRNSKIVNFLGSVLFFEPTPKVLEKENNTKQVTTVPCRKTTKKMIENSN